VIVESKHINLNLFYNSKANNVIRTKKSLVKVVTNNVNISLQSKKINSFNSFTRYKALDEIVKVSDPVNLTFMVCSDHDNIEMDKRKPYKRNFKLGDFLGPFTVTFTPEEGLPSLDYTATVDFEGATYSLNEAANLFKKSTVKSMCVVKIEANAYLKGVLQVNCPTKLESNIHIITKSSPVQGGREFVYNLFWHDDDLEVNELPTNILPISSGEYPIINTYSDSAIKGYQGKNAQPAYGNSLSLNLHSSGSDNIQLFNPVYGGFILPRVYLSYSTLNYLKDDATWQVHKNRVLTLSEPLIAEYIMKEDRNAIDMARYSITLGSKEQYSLEGNNDLNIFIYIDFSLRTYADLTVANNSLDSCLI